MRSGRIQSLEKEEIVPVASLDGLSRAKVLNVNYHATFQLKCQANCYGNFWQYPIVIVRQRTQQHPTFTVQKGNQKMLSNFTASASSSCHFFRLDPAWTQYI